MSLESNTPTAEPERIPPEIGDGVAPFEERSWNARSTTMREARNNPSMTLRAGREPMTVVVDRVRARPAASPTLSYALGQNAMGLGVWGTFFPRSVNRFLGMNADTSTVRVLFGLREFYTAFSLAGDPTRKDVLWTRVAGDIFDIAVLKSLDRPDNPKRGNARLALGVVVAVTALDAIAAWRMSTVKRNCL
ncbi:MAG TPA: hypothetical protein VD906_02220 [Caulobacteraceae bacterium]|nr:hypothetical protein [Caulobacteraceae bacterium]